MSTAPVKRHASVEIMSVGTSTSMNMTVPLLNKWFHQKKYGRA